MTLMRLITIKYFNRLTALVYIYTFIFTPGHPEILDKRGKREEPRAIPNWLGGVGQPGKVGIP
jgi:hypothetical protein